MPNIEEQAIVTEIEDAMHRNREIHNAEIRREVTAALRNLITDGASNLGCKFGESIKRKMLEVGRALQSGKKRGMHR